jgi:hypothetical protein
MLMLAIRASPVLVLRGCLLRLITRCLLHPLRRDGSTEVGESVAQSVRG